MCGSRLDQRLLGDYESLMALLNDSRARKIITSYATYSKRGLNGDDFLKIVDRVQGACLGATPIIPLDICAKIGHALWSSIGITKSAQREREFLMKFGYVSLSCICYLSKNGMEIISTSEGASRCVIEARVPGTLLTYEGRLYSSIQMQGSAAQVSVAVAFRGQAFDWGRSHRLLDDLMNNIEEIGSLLMSDEASQ